MKHYLIPCLLVWAVACFGQKTDDSVGTEANTEVNAENETNTGRETEPDIVTETSTGIDSITDIDEHPLGEPMPSFSLEDINPSSATYGETISSADLLGSPYGLVFLDSRCVACADVADDLWAEYEARPDWWDTMPTFAVESYRAMDMSPLTADDLVDNNNLPYLLDTEEMRLWQNSKALNHDFFAVSAEGILDAWFPMYSWPEDLKMFTEFMTERYGDGETDEEKEHAD